jgi:glycosyltransferase involved in cell wall biosynthesis
MEGRVSVIIRAFNSEKYIGDALKSVINQDYEGVISTIVCYDEGSDDRTLDIVLGFQENTSSERSIRIVRHTHLTPFRALQKCGFENVDGEYIFFLDYDNYYPSNYIKEVVSEAMRYNASFVFTRALVVNKKRSKTSLANGNPSKSI